MNNKIIGLIAAIAIVVIGTGIVGYYLYQDPFYIVKPGIKVENDVAKNDKDKDGTFDADDIVEGARGEIANRTKYKSAYYVGGYPPSNEGVCTDVVWRAFLNAGYNLKDMMDQDITANLSSYPNINNSPDPNIDFRRVKNQYDFFRRNALSLTIDVKPYDVENLKQWKPGDIVVLKSNDHVAVISDKRRKDGVPYIIHNASSHPIEQNLLARWYINKRIIGHFRYPK